MIFNYLKYNNRHLSSVRQDFTLFVITLIVEKKIMKLKKEAEQSIRNVLFKCSFIEFSAVRETG